MYIFILWFFISYAEFEKFEYLFILRDYLQMNKIAIKVVSMKSIVAVFFTWLNFNDVN